MPKHLSRLYFLSRGCKQCPIELTIKPLWANGQDGYFLSASGTKLKLHHGKSQRTPGMKCHNGKRGQIHPKFRPDYGNHYYHRIMAETYADEPCPIFFDSKGKPYKGFVHHVIENPYDIRVDNLMWWLSFQQHHIADKRRRALEEVLPNMYVVPTKRLKLLEDPRKTSQEDFEFELKKLKKAMKHFTYNPSESIDSRMSRDMSRHMEL